MLARLRSLSTGRALTLRFTILLVVLAVADWISRKMGGSGVWPLFSSNPYLWWSVLFGILTGAAEVIARYRDEPFAATASPPGLWYLALNGTISGMAYGLLTKYKDRFPGLTDDLMRSIAAGFGAMVLMRSKLFNFKTEGGEEYAIGPDAVLSTFLSSVDRKIDRYRALRRQQIVFDQTSQIARPAVAPPFLRTSLASYQNLSTAEKAELDAAIKAVLDNPTLDDRLKLIAISFGFLNVCGEKNFSDVMDQLRRFQGPPAP